MLMRLTHKFLMTSGLIATMGLAACGGTDDQTAMNDTGFGDTTMAASATMSGTRDFGTEQNVFTYLNTSSALEIQSAELAVANATSPQVREFAQALITDRRQMQERLAPLMAGAAPQELDQSDDLVSFHRSAVDDLGGEEAGQEWDREWVENQIDMHERILNDLDDALRSNARPELQTQLTEAQTTMRQHLQQARQLHVQLGGDANWTSTSGGLRTPMMDGGMGAGTAGTMGTATPPPTR